MQSSDKRTLVIIYSIVREYFIFLLSITSGVGSVAFNMYPDPGKKILIWIWIHGNNSDTDP